MGKTIVLIDGSNLYSMANKLNINIDYTKLKKYFEDKAYDEGNILLRIIYFTTIKNRKEEQPLIKLLDWLEYNGYTMITKPVKTYINDNNEEIIKGNMDCEICIKALELIYNCNDIEKVILVSGDGDFVPLVSAIQDKGIHVEVISTIKSSPPLCSDELRRQTDTFTDINNLNKAILHNDN